MIMRGITGLRAWRGREAVVLDATRGHCQDGCVVIIEE